VTEANRNLAIRILTSAVVAPIVIYLIYRGGWVLALLFGAAAAISALEFYEITMKGWSPAAWAGIAVTGAFPLLPMLGDRWGNAAFFLVVAFGMFAWTYHLVRGPLKEGPQYVSYLVTGMVYSAAAPTSLVALRLLGGDRSGGHWVMVVMYLSFLNDTFAYFTGRAIGKHKLYPEVSPNKTWEGFFGGLLGAPAGLFVFRWLGFHDLTVVDVLILSVAGGILGPLGDFSESMLKRAYGVKDSGKIIPGHGGILDRIDAVIFNAPIVFLYAYYLRPLLGGV
jgi:phosphatidate cytidylyltransferase